MCGIAGIVGSLKSSDRALLNKSLCSLRHRGPDSGASWFSPEGTAALGHRRLSIIDTTTNSDQPFVSGDGKFILVFNGEIYNFY